ncbi:uncharacterized protein LOC115631843 [Scaptodrosophila lebanonensis]|uniref:Uncharacterized protein LOC115631843 n=1 Tax=Drosophila lebanonensis TaxID=7225 RepID=A0A6J2U7Q0_DROLE|nr:uncharacterized protein LOC115631843 [Scaptodrosophila lebanonensis]
MSDPISGTLPRFVYNSLLLGSASYAAWCIDSDTYPCAFAACVVGGVSALVGILRALFGSGQAEEYRKLRDVNSGVLELVPLPLVNIDLYAESQGMGALALGHCVFVVALSFDLGCSLAKDRKDCDISEMLRDLTVMGNIISLGFLAFMERNFIYVRMALIMGVMKYGSLFVDSIHEGVGEDLQVLGTAIFLYWTAKAFNADLTD